MLSPNDFNRFMFIALSIETESWGYACKGTFTQRDKQLLENFLNSAKLLRKQLERSINMDIVNDLSEVFSKSLEKIAKTEDNKTRNELFALLEAWTKGLVETSNDQVFISPDERPS